MMKNSDVEQLNKKTLEIEKLIADKGRVEIEYKYYRTKVDEELANKTKLIDSLRSDIKKHEDAQSLLEKQLLAKEDLIANISSELKEEREFSAKLKAEIQRLEAEKQELLSKPHMPNTDQPTKTQLPVKEEIKQEENAERTLATTTETPNGQEVLSLSVSMDSVLRLNNPSIGWRLIYSDLEKYELIKKKPLIYIAVIGMYDVGKSWFCNKLAGRNVLASGYSHTTNSLDILYPDETRGSLIGIIDTPGSNEAIKVTDEELIKMLDSVKGKSEKEAKMNLDQIYFSRYKKLKNDARIIQDLKERFIREITDILVVVCNKLSEKEQEVLFKVINHHKEITKERLKEAQDQRKEARETTLLVVHNFKNHTMIDEVKAQIKKDLSKSFKIEELPMFSEGRDDFKELNNMIYRDQFGIIHLILAAEGSEAGSYYNKPTFAYLKSKLSTMSQRTATDIAKHFLEFCNKNLPSILKQDIKLKFDKDQRAIIKEDSSQDIVLENLHYDEFGNFSVFSTVFEPRYSIDEKIIDPLTGKRELIVGVEVLDSEFKASYIRHSDGMYYLTVEGKKDVLTGADLNNSMKSLSNNRELGEFKLKIPLSDEELKSLRKEPKEGKPDSGIMRYIFTFEKMGPCEI